MFGRLIVVLAVVALVVVFVLSGGGGMIGAGTGTGTGTGMMNGGAWPAGMMDSNGSGFTSLGIGMLLVGVLVILGVLWLLSSLLRPGRPAIDAPLTDSSRSFDAPLTGSSRPIDAPLTGSSRPIDAPLTGSTRPIDILNERYARGEITRADYNRMRDEVAA